MFINIENFDAKKSTIKVKRSWINADEKSRTPSL